MKKLILAFALFFTFNLLVNAQSRTNKDGSPDMRYKQNQQLYGNTTSSSSTFTPSFSTPKYEAPKSTYSTSTSTYTNPYTNTKSSLPSYPTKKDGTPDMRYKENRSLYIPYNN
jgi:hypothetical protein